MEDARNAAEEAPTGRDRREVEAGRRAAVARSIGFVANAPEEVVAQEREKRAAYVAELEALKTALECLS